MGVERLDETAGGERSVGVEVGDLADGVNAGIGAATGVDAAAAAVRLGNGRFQRFLNRAEAGLSLPAVRSRCRRRKG